VGGWAPTPKNPASPGGSRAIAGPDYTDRDFTAQYLDSGSGLHFCNARYYDSALGRFISPDSLIPGIKSATSFNRYAYVQNNPLRYTDPSGHDSPTSQRGGSGAASIAVPGGGIGINGRPMTEPSRWGTPWPKGTTTATTLLAAVAVRALREDIQVARENVVVAIRALAKGLTKIDKLKDNPPKEFYHYTDEVGWLGTLKDGFIDTRGDPKRSI
jgi:RHS repeat-associated protein